MLDYILECPFRKKYYDEDCATCDDYGKTCRLFEDYGPACMSAEDLQFRANFDPLSDTNDNCESSDSNPVEEDANDNQDNTTEALLAETQEQLRRYKLYASRLKAALYEARATIQTKTEAEETNKREHADLGLIANLPKSKKNMIPSLTNITS